VPKPRWDAGCLAAVRAREFGPLSIQPLTSAKRPFSVLRIAMRPGSSTPPLSHARTSEFFLVIEGGMRARVSGRLRSMRKGDFAFLPPGTVHEFLVGRRGAVVLVVFCPAYDLGAPDNVLLRPSDAARILAAAAR
jgi:quercetin dioxygenase-like cupin family protein